MTMLMHGFDRPVDSQERGELVTDAARAYPVAIKRFCLYALTIPLAGGALAGAIALKTAIYFWRHNL